MKTMEQTIIKNLLLSPTYMSDFLPYVRGEYMSPMHGHRAERVLIETIKDYFDTFKQQPSKTAIELQLQKKRNLSEQEYKDATTMLMTLDSIPDPSDYLYAETDKWIKKQAAHCALTTCIAIFAAEQEGKTLKSGMDMNKVMADVALAGRQTKLGHAYVGDAASRWTYYQVKDVHIPFDLTEFNRFTSGGLARKRIMGIMGDTGVGKSLVLCHFAASFVRSGYNVLYITFEMPSHELAERIDANLLDVALHTVRDLPREMFDAKIADLRLPAEVVIEEYPEHGAGLNEFKALLKKLEQVRKFKPDVVLVDYLNKCGSSRFRFDSFTKHHEYYGSIANELYQLAKDINVGVICAIQTNRAAKSADSPGTEHVAGSNKISEALNYLVAVEKDEVISDQFKISVPKNRHDVQPAPFVVKVDHSRMRLYDHVLEKSKNLQSERSAQLYAKLKGQQLNDPQMAQAQKLQH
jgi:replicative DNA helicase